MKKNQCVCVVQVNYVQGMDKISPALPLMANVYDMTGKTSATMFSVTTANPQMLMTVWASMTRPGWSDQYVEVTVALWRLAICCHFPGKGGC